MCIALYRSDAALKGEVSVVATNFSDIKNNVILMPFEKFRLLLLRWRNGSALDF